MVRLTIKSEEEAWALLERAYAGEVFDEHTELAFEGWPTFEMKVQGRDWDSSVPTRIMSPLLEVQKDLSRAYAEVRYGSSSLHKLKEDEREQLEIVVKVEKGSSDFKADLAKQFTEIALRALERMDGTQAVILVLGLAVTLGGSVGFRAWLQHRKEIKGLDVQLADRQLDVKRLEVLAEVAKIQPAVQSALVSSIETNNKLLKALKPDDSVAFKGERLTGGAAQEVTQPERAASEDILIEGVFRVLGNRTDQGDGFRVTLQRVTDQLVVKADIPGDLNPLQKAAVKEAEWGKWQLDMSMNASILRGAIHSAVVISARKHTEPDADT